MRAIVRRDDESGFTLIEALFSIVILVFGLLAITNLMIVGASSNSTANQSTATTALASQQLETLKALPFTSLTAGGSLTADANGDFRDEVIDGVGPIHTRWQISTATNPQTLFIRVRSEPVGGFLKSRARAEFSTFRTCTAQPLGCP
jgi:type II secretory pathway pseudopilin PulG